MKPVLYGIVGVLSTVIAMSSLPALAYTPTSEDHELVGRLFDRIESIYEHDTEKLLAVYEVLPHVRSRYMVYPQLDYLLSRIESHVKLVLFTSVYGDERVCLPEYVQEGDTVEMNYTLKNFEGVVLDTTWKDVAEAAGKDMENDLPLVFNAGKGQVVKGVDKGVLGTKSGEKKSFLIDAEDAYGAWNPSMLFVTSRERLEAKVGALSETESYSVQMTMIQDGETVLMVGRIVEMNDEKVTIDFNHPLAGQMIRAMISVEGFFKACTEDTKEEENLDEESTEGATIMIRTTLK